MRSLFIYATLIPLLVSAGITTDDPVLPRAVVLRYQGTIVNPDAWTPFPTASPVVTDAPSAFPTETATDPMEPDYNLRSKGGRKECHGETEVSEVNCLEAAVIAGGKDYNFPYYLNKVTSMDVPCGCFFWWNDNNNIIATYNHETTSCSKHPNSKPICRSCGSNTEKQGDYRGDISVTQTGIPCQTWVDQFPHIIDPIPHGHGTHGAKNSNRCRNPNGEQSRAWCYTTDPAVRWDYCDVPYC